MSRSDGAKPGTNYNHTISRWRIDPAAELAVATGQARACGEGRHDEAVAQPNRVTYLAYGRRIEPGTRYCRYCSTVLPNES